MIRRNASCRKEQKKRVLLEMTGRELASRRDQKRNLESRDEEVEIKGGSWPKFGRLPLVGSIECSDGKLLLAVALGFVPTVFRPAFMFAVVLGGFGLVLVSLLVRVLNLLRTGLATLLASTIVVARALCPLPGGSRYREQRNGNQSQAQVFHSLHRGLLQPRAFSPRPGTRMLGRFAASVDPQRNWLILWDLRARVGMRGMASLFQNVTVQVSNSPGESKSGEDK